MAIALNWKARSRGAKIAIVLVTVAVLLLFAAWIAAMVLRPAYPTPAQLTAAAKAQAALTGGAKAYAARCAYCHDKGFAPSIAGRPELTAESMTPFVRHGIGNMPAFPATEVSDADLAAVAKYLAQLPKQETAK